jgi:hypothetical protein
MTVMTVPVGDRDHDRARMIDGQGLGAVLIGHATGVVRGPAGRPDHGPPGGGGALVRHGH